MTVGGPPRPSGFRGLGLQGLGFRVSGSSKHLVGLVRFVSFVFSYGCIQLIRIERLGKGIVEFRSHIF